MNCESLEYQENKKLNLVMDNPSQDFIKKCLEIGISVKKHKQYDKVKLNIVGAVPYGYDRYKVLCTEISGETYLITKIRKNGNEQKMFELIKMMYFGSAMKPFYKLIREILRDDKYVLEGYDKILYGNMNHQDIADTLNSLNLLKREKNWTDNSVKNIIRKIIDKSIDDKETIIYHQEYGIFFQNFWNPSHIFFKGFNDFPELKKIYMYDDDFNEELKEEQINTAFIVLFILLYMTLIYLSITYKCLSVSII
jgi:hypothetical protein